MAADLALLLSLAGPVLAGYLTDPATIEVMCNDNGRAFLTRFGQGTVEVAHPGWGHLDRFLGAVAHETGQEWRDGAPRLSAALADVGWRIQAARPPASPAIMLSLRTHPQQIFTLDDYEAQGILIPRQRLILEEALHTGKRLVVAGGVGSAKTSLINAFLHVLKATRKRMVLIEDDPELHCEARNCVHLRVVKGQGTLRDLVRDSLRLNPDWIVVGEVRGGEALEMLKAFQTGHSGLTTVHVDAVEHTMSRLEQAVQEVSTDPQRELIGEVIDLAVHMAKAGTSWRCTGILALHGYAQGAYHTEPVG